MTIQPVYFVQISDSHIGPTPEFERHGQQSYPCARQAVDVVNNLPVRPDFVIHTGDIVTEPHPDSYALAAQTFNQIDVPTYYVTGNHDTAADIRKYMSMGPHTDCFADSDLLSYTFEIKGHRFLVIDARGPDEIDPHGLVSSIQMDVLRRECTPAGPPLTIFIHFPLLRFDSIWMDAYMLVVNGTAVHKTLLPACDRIRGVFFGHIHQNMQVVKDGILYVSAASLFAQFTAWPGAAVTGMAPEHPPGFNFVHLLPDRTIIHQHLFNRPV